MYGIKEPGGIRMRIRYGIYLLLAAIVGAGCGSDSPTGPSSRPGTFSAKVTGAVEIEMSGEAVFNSQGFDMTTGTPGRLVILSAASPQLGMGLHMAFPGNFQPGQATYEIGQYDTSAENLFDQELDPERVYVVVTLPDEESTAVGFFSVSGSVRITTAAASAFGGEFELTARTTDFNNEGERIVEVTGNFSAIGS